MPGIVTDQRMCTIPARRKSLTNLPRLFDMCLSAKLAGHHAQHHCVPHRNTTDGTDHGSLHLGHVLWHSLEEASCAPLDLAAAAFAGLGWLLAQSDVSLIMLMRAIRHALRTQH